MIDKQPLYGGRDGITRDQDRIYRPAGAWSKTVHQLLAHIRRQGFTAAPTPLGFTETGEEIVSFIEGEVYNYPLEGAIATQGALCSAAALLRQYHDATVSFVGQLAANNYCWMLPERLPQQVICHGDFAPYNVVLQGEQTIGIFDFDTAHPAPRLWDIAYAVYCWAPFKTNREDAMGTLASQIARARLFCDSYGFVIEERSGLVEAMVARIQALVDFMQAEAASGNSAFQANIADGHHLSYLADIQYLLDHQSMISEGLLVT